MIAVFTFTGCGGPEKPQGAPEAEIKVWAEMQGIGKSDQDISAVTGVPKAEVDKLYKTTKDTMIETLKMAYLLNDKNAAELADYWMETLLDDEVITTKLKEANDTNPVVELTFKAMDPLAVKDMIEADNDLLQFMQLLEQAKADPAEKEKALNDDEFQDIVLNVIKTKIVDEMPYKAPVTMDVKCQIVTGEDGKTHWGPADPNAVANFLKK